MRELVCQAGLGLELVTGSIGLDRIVEGVHLSDLTDPTPWMTRGMVLITTGVTFASSADEGNRLLDRLAACDTVALGVGVGHHLDHVPQAMIEHAEKLRMPIFEAPLSVPFRTIVRYVYSALGSNDLHHMRRTMAVQSRLLDLILRESDVGELVASLSDMLNMSVALFDHRGRVLAARAPRGDAGQVAAQLWEVYEQSAGDVGPLGVIEGDLGRCYIRKVQIHGVVERVLAGRLPHGSTSEVVEQVMGSAEKLIGVDLLKRREELLSHRRARDLLMDDFLGERMSPDEALARMREEGLDLSRPWRLAACEVRRDHAPLSDGQTLNREALAYRTRLLDAVDVSLGATNSPFLCRVQGQILKVVIGEEPGDPGRSHRALESLREALRAVTGADVIVGASALVAGCGSIRRHSRQAAEALQRAAAADGASVVLYEDLPRRLHLLEDQSSEMLETLHEQLVRPLVDYDREHGASLVRTLRVLFRECLSTHRASEALFVHRNTLRKRLRRIETLLGVDLDDMEDVIDLNLALQASDLLHTDESGSPKSPA